MNEVLKFPFFLLCPIFRWSRGYRGTTFRLMQKLADVMKDAVKEEKEIFPFFYLFIFYSVTWNLPFTCTKDVLIGCQLAAEEYLEQLWKRGNYSKCLTGGEEGP